MKFGKRNYNKMNTRNLIIDTQYYTSLEIAKLFESGKVWFFNDGIEISYDYHNFRPYHHDLRININEFINGTIDFTIDEYGNLAKIAKTENNEVYYIE